MVICHSPHPVDRAASPLQVYPKEHFTGTHTGLSNGTHYWQLIACYSICIIVLLDTIPYKKEKILFWELRENAGPNAVY